MNTVNTPRIRHSLIALIAALFLATGLVACSGGGGGGAAATTEKVDNANKNQIPRLNQISQELAGKGIDLTRDREIPDGLSDSDVARIRSILTEYVVAGNEVIDTANRSDVYYSSYEKAKLQGWIAQANTYHGKLAGYEAKEAARKEGRSSAEAEATRVKSVKDGLVAKSTQNIKMFEAFYAKFGFPLNFDLTSEVDQKGKETNEVRIAVTRFSAEKRAEAIADAEAHVTFAESIIADVSSIEDSPGVDKAAAFTAKTEMGKMVGWAKATATELRKIQAEVEAKAAKANAKKP